MKTTTAEKPADALAGLAVEASTITAEAANDPGAPPAANDQQAEPEQSNAEIISGVLQMVRDAGCELADLKTPKIVASDRKLANIGMLWGKVCDKHNWNLQSMMKGYQLEIMATIATLALAREVSGAVTAELAARRRDTPAANDTPEPAAELAG